MKKRLLSAALALAMVLTMLPMSVFAATLSASYQTEAKKDAVYATGTFGGAGFYTGSGTAASPYTAASGGAILSAGSFNQTTGAMTRTNSGNHAANLATDAGTASSFTLLADGQTITTAQTNVTIDLNGHTLAKVTMSKGGTLTIGNSDYGTSKPAKAVTAVEFTNSGNDTGATVKIGEGVSVTTLTLLTARANSVTLLNGEAGGVTMDGTGTTSGGKTANAKQTLTLTGLNAKITGNVSVKGDSSAISVTNGAMSGDKVELTGVGTTLNLQNGTAKAVTVLGSVADGDKGKTAPKIIINGYGAQVDSIGKMTGDEKVAAAVTVEVTNGGAVTGDIELPTGKVTVANGSADGITLENNSTLTLGSTTNKLTATKVGDLTLGSAAGTPATYGSVVVDVIGSKVTTGAITAETDNNKTITLNIPADQENNFGTITKDAKMSPNTIKGGNFTGAVDATLLTGVFYQMVNTANTGFTYSYWADSAINDLVAKYVDGTTTVTVLGSAATPGSTLTLKQTDEAGGTPQTVFEVKFDNTQTFTLPSVVGGRTIKEWTSTGSTPITGGMPVSVTGNKEYLAGSLSHQATKVTRTTSGTPGVSAVLSGNVITLSGTVGTTGTNTIDINLITDAGDVAAQASVVGNANGTVGTLLFVDNGIKTATNGVIQLADNNTALELVNTGVKYTLRDGGLKVQASGLNLDGNGNAAGSKADAEVTVTDTKLGNKDYLDNLSKTLTALGVEGVDFSGSPAVLEKFGQAIGTISTSQVASYRRTAQDQAFRKQHNNQSAKDDNDRMSTGYYDVYAVLYLDVKVSSLGKSGSTGNMTATLTPSWRVEVRGGSDPIVVKTGASLGALTGEAGSTQVSLPVGDGFTMTGLKAHQNNTYVYDVTAGTKVATFTITHAANSGDGFGTIVLGTDTAPIFFQRKANGDPVGPEDTTTGNVKYYYSSLQAAVNDTIDGDTISVGPEITGQQSITVTGKARKFDIKVTGSATVSGPSGSSLVSVEPNGNTYTVQLKQDVASTNPSAEVTITVGTTTNGVARANVSKAKAGDTVTVTLTPNAGAVASGVTIRTNTGVNVTATSNGSNSYTFKVPAGATSVTVTPSFTKTTTTLPFTDVPTTAWYYNGVEYCYNTIRGSARLMQGMSATTFGPNTGFTRAQVVQILWNIKGCPEPKTTYNPYTDISSIHYAYKAMLWATQNGYAEGYVDKGVRTFRPNQNVTRQEMAVFLWRAAGKPTNYNSLNLNAYADGYMVYDWAQPAMRWAIARGVLSGQSSVALGNYLSPRSVAYRSEVAVTVMNFDKLAVFR